MRQAASTALVVMALGFPWHVAQVDAPAESPAGAPVPPAGGISADSVPRVLPEATDDNGHAALWVGAVTGVSGLAAFAFSVRRPSRAAG